MKIEIKHYTTGGVLFTHEVENNTMRQTVEAAVEAGTHLAGADLTGALLAGANLTDAYLTGANLTGALLTGAYLTGADLTGALLAGANLAGANLTDANLTRAYLTGAYLTGADLTGADLDGEVLTKPPISLTNLRWHVLITQQYLRIGCRRYTHEEWANFDDEAISEMDTEALAFWGQWKGPLLALCAAQRGVKS